MTPLPTAPNRGMDQETFSTTGDTFLAALPPFVTEANALQVDVTTKQTTASAAATTATTQAGIATTQAGIATTQAGIATTQAGIATSAATSAAANSVLQKYTFSTTTTMADPSAGNMRFNSATYSSVTTIALADQTADTGNPNIESWLLTFDDSTNTVKGQLIFSEAGIPTNFAIYNITGLTNNAGWVQLTVTYVTHSGSFANGDTVVMDFKRVGDAGAAGGVTSINGLTGVLTDFTTDAGTSTLTNKTLADPKISLGGTNGTSGQVLTSAGAGVAPTWTSLPAAGSMTLVAKISPTNGAASVAQTGIASYKSLLIFYQRISVSATADIRFRFSVDNGSTYSSERNFGNAVSSTLTGRAGFAQIYLANSSGEIKVSFYTASPSTTTFNDLDNSITGVINALQFSVSAGTFAGAGSFYIYGVN